MMRFVGAPLVFVLLIGQSSCGHDNLMAEPPTLFVVSHIDFGEVQVGTLATETFTLGAGGPAGVHIDAISVDDDELGLDLSGPVELRAYETTSVTLGWSPLVVRALTAEVTIASDAAASPQRVVVTGTAVDRPSCDDLNACTDDTWDDVSEACVFTPNTTACDDQDLCTVGDVCGGGTCAGLFSPTADPSCAPGCSPLDRAAEDPFSGRWFEEIWSGASDDVWAVGSAGISIHWDGTDWTVIDTCTTATLFSVFGVTSDDVWAVGSNATVVHWNGVSWTPLTVEATGTLWSVWASGATDVWMVGDAGQALHGSAAAMAPISSATVSLLYSVSGAGGDVWAVGEGGAVVRSRGGAAFQAQTSPTSMPLFSVRASSIDNVWAVGNSGTVHRWNGSAWSSVAGVSGGSFFSVWTAGPNEAWVGGASGNVQHYVSGTWSDASFAGGGTLYGLFGKSSEVWVAGSTGVMRHFDGSSWAIE